MSEITAAPPQNDFASSSTASASATTPYVHYDISINFCDYNDSGRDVNTFVSELCRCLKFLDLQVSLDKPDFLCNDTIPPKIEDAILAASVHIVIFTPNYALSKRCLNELVLMLKTTSKSRSTIIPVFYYANPTWLRTACGGSKGPYAKALRKYENDSQRIKDWEWALSNVADICGFVLDERHRNEEDLLHNVIETVTKDFPYGSPYDVFINHRGPDVKETFATSLYNRLCSCGLRVFLDMPEMVPGNHIPAQIEAAIQFARVNIGIFSPKYVESRWCLDELLLMLSSPTTILPIFYKVRRSDVQSPNNGVYAEALLKHEQRYDWKTLQNWRDALSNVAKLPGHELADRNDEELLDKTVKSVLDNLAKRSEGVRNSEVQSILKSVLKENVLKISVEEALPSRSHSELSDYSVEEALPSRSHSELSDYSVEEALPSRSHSKLPYWFTSGQEIATLLVSCGILSKAWEESCLADNSGSFILNEYDGVAYVAFPSFNKIEGFIANESRYGEGSIQTNKVFSCCLKGNDDQPALVHQGALKLFFHIMENTDFQAKVQIYTDPKQRKLKPIIFVGHSLGGSVATLATLWVLEKRLRQSSPFCITFGCPLVGDARLVEAVGRENWAGNFCHVVSKHDIVPRMLLAPFESIAEPLIRIFPYWQGIMADASETLPDSFIQEACRTLLNNVLQYANTVANYGLNSPMELDGAIKRSPYRPFGTYMFCSGEGAACIDNSETVLKLLHMTMQSHENLYDSFTEHLGYGSLLEHVMKKSISGRRIPTLYSESSYKMGMSLQLEAIGVGAENDHAQIALQKSGNIENEHNTNVAKLAIELSQHQCTMAELEWYKERCEKKDGIPYYDSFREQGRMDIDANFRRVRLAGFWDEIIEKWLKHELPSDFQSQNKWINAGTAYRRLAEPLDIAYYYRTSNADSNYITDLEHGRPHRYKVLQKWMEEKEITRSSRGHKARTKLASLTQDSCFWAYVEEALKDLKIFKQDQRQKLESLEMFEGYMTRMINDRNISADVFLEGSSFMEWWKEWKECKQNQFPEWSSPLYKIMESESWKG